MIYTIGYGFKTPRDLIKLADKLEAHIVDVRFRPFSQRHEWNRWELERAWGARYTHLPEWGNETHREGRITLHDYPGGLTKVRALHEAHGNVLLFCACSTDASCHRRSIRERLEDIYEPCKEARWPELPPGVYWDKLTKTLKRDRLAALEEWAEKHPDKMDAERQFKLAECRMEYAFAEDAILDHLRRREVETGEADAWAISLQMAPDTAREVMKRLEKRKTIMVDRAQSISGGWVYWWTLYKTPDNADTDEDNDDEQSSGDDGAVGGQSAGRKGRRRTVRGGWGEYEPAREGVEAFVL